jgi:5'-nucleotidase/UDP-sugar diphosphatase
LLKKAYRVYILFPLVVLLAVACTPQPAQTPAPAKTEIPYSEPVSITVLYTNDEHGWMAGDGDNGGAATMMYLWTEEEGYTEDEPFLILSGGDTWTGPAISSWFDGESMVEVMNEMGYDAAAIGNHEFDYGLAGLQERSSQALFPFLSANIYQQDTETPATFALPYVIQTVSDVQVGIIGLSSRSTPKTTMPTHVEGLDFVPYARALEAVVPQVKNEGAEIIIVISHLCSYEQLALAPKAAQLDVAIIGGGHCHETFNQTIDGVALVQAGSYMRAYGRIDITYDPNTAQITDIAVAVKPNDNRGKDNQISSLVAGWQDKIDAELQHVIGYTQSGFKSGSDEMMNMVADAWLAYYPAAAAISNPGGFRQDIPSGEITLADIVGVLPFDNYLIDVELTGAQLINSINHGNRRPALGGVTTLRGISFLDGTPVDRSATYHVLVNNYIYAGGDGYLFNAYDPDAYETGIDWRQPVIEWIISRNSSQDNPLENFIDAIPR